jgi:hypothetical protein
MYGLSSINYSYSLHRTLKTGRGDNQKLLNELQAMGLAKVGSQCCGSGSGRIGTDPDLDPEWIRPVLHNTRICAVVYFLILR